MVSRAPRAGTTGPMKRMLYAALGMATWKVAKRYVRRRLRR